MTKYKGLLRTVQHLSDYQMNGRIGRRRESYRAADLDYRTAASRIPRALPKPSSTLGSMTAQGQK